MKMFENNSMNTYSLKPKKWKSKIDDTNMKWPHGKLELDKFWSSEMEFLMTSNLPWN